VPGRSRTNWFSIRRAVASLRQRPRPRHHGRALRRPVRTLPLTISQPTLRALITRGAGICPGTIFDRVRRRKRHDLFCHPSYNEESLLGQTLRASTTQPGAGGAFEVIVADDASTTARPRSLRSMVPASFPATSQIAATRNAGARAACGEMLSSWTPTRRSTRLPSVPRSGRCARGGRRRLRFRFDGNIPLYGRVMAAVAIPFIARCGLPAGASSFARARHSTPSAASTNGSLGGRRMMSWRLDGGGALCIAGDSDHLRRKLRAYSAREILGCWRGWRAADPTRFGSERGWRFVRRAAARPRFSAGKAECYGHDMSVVRLRYKLGGIRQLQSAVREGRCGAWH